MKQWDVSFDGQTWMRWEWEPGCRPDMSIYRYARLVPEQPPAAEAPNVSLGTCVVCDQPAGFVVMGTFRCAPHRETTVVGKPEGPAPEPRVVAIPSRCYYDCIDGYHVCGKERK